MKILMVTMKMDIGGAETHILEFSGDLYGQTVRVELLKFVRPEQKFESVQALQKQVALDITAAKEYFITER